MTGAVASLRSTSGTGARTAALLLPFVAAAPLSFAKPAAALGLLAVYLLALCFALSKRDATSFLTGFLLLDVLLPSDLVIKGMGAMGRPTSLVGLLALLWWAVSRMLPDQGSAPGTQPIRIAMA